MAKKIDVLMPVASGYDALNYMTIKAFEALSRTKYNCRLITKEKLFKTPVEDPPDMTFSLNAPPLDDQAKFLCDKIKVPHFSYLVDPPFRFVGIFNSPYLYAGCDDRYSIEFLKDMDFERSWFCPHAVERDLAPDEDRERDIDVLMMASYTDYRSYKEEWTRLLPEIVSKVLEDAAEITFSDDATTFIEAFSIAYQNRLYLTEKPKKIALDFIFPLMMLERYIKGRERISLVKSIKDAKVHIYGGKAKDSQGWESELGSEHPNVTVHGPLSYQEGLELMKRSKIVINTSIKNKNGAHERIFNGLACGALVLSNESVWLREYFEDEKNILFFKTYKLDEVNDKINKYLADEGLRQNVAKAGRQEVMARHTWDHRFQSLYDVWDGILSN